MNKHILITQQELANYGGSEVVTLELSNALLELGFRVTIQTNYFGLPISNEFNEDVEIIDFNAKIDVDNYSHFWIHHNLIPEQLLDCIDSGKPLDAVIAYHHMSPYVPVETPLVPQLEEKIADYIFFNSQETLDAHEHLFKTKRKLFVLGNPAPDAFYSDQQDGKHGGLNSLLVVSNHVPEELRKALGLLNNEGISTVTLGVSGKPELVTPAKIDQVDAVVSIGKTVQYTLLKGKPVYCYDHFGGSGYLSKRNFEKNRYYNFSGRGFKRKAAELIASEIKTKYSIAARAAIELQALYAQDFILSKQLESYCQLAHRPRKLEVSPTSVEHQKLMVKMNNSNVQSIIYLRNEVNRLKSDSDTLNTVIREKNSVITELEERVNKTLRSKLDRVKRRVIKAVQRS